MLTPLSLTPLFGLGNSLGLATPGHIAVVRVTGLTPVFAQQSVRENTRTDRTLTDDEISAIKRLA
jgi:tagaturonate epimerase